MQIPTKYRNNVLRVARHEAGHYITSRVLGFDVGEIKLTITDFQGGHTAGSQITLARPITSLEEIAKYLEERILILYSGSLAEAMVGGVIDNTSAINILRSGGGARDFDKIKELLNILRNIKFPDAREPMDLKRELDALDNELINRAGDIVTQEASLIDGLAARISSEVKQLNQSCVLAEPELKNLPTLVARFGNNA